MLEDNGLTPIELKAKEGLAMINGTQFICAVGCEALCRAEQLAKQADVIAAMYVFFGNFQNFCCFFKDIRSIERYCQSL